MEKPKSTVGHTYGPAAAGGQPERAVPQLWTCSGYKLTKLHIYSTTPQPFFPILNEAISQGPLVSPVYMFVLGHMCDLFNALPTADHVSHLENVSEDEINRLLGMVVDVENLFMSVHKEEDTDTKQVYFYLFKVSERVSGISAADESDLTITSMCLIFVSPVQRVSSFTLQYRSSFSTVFPLAAEEMHPADEPASRRGIPWKSTL